MTPIFHGFLCLSFCSIVFEYPLTGRLEFTTHLTLRIVLPFPPTPTLTEMEEITRTGPEITDDHNVHTVNNREFYKCQCTRCRITITGYQEVSYQSLRYHRKRDEKEVCPGGRPHGQKLQTYVDQPGRVQKEDKHQREARVSASNSIHRRVQMGITT
ncbi:hypothetical protein AG1IA_00879 [Rhizoctonia solani AG-1 IA]|uniref:Uncharacterized protein n=1 Tax=Thanatephorus cucumeris (strain AG1-IA) TaxID=983506 RepID=L8X4F4_THACA|nr:hypothetical protein AG1IA_00879 [Rhizoctonia solani AG-1 IA]